MAFARASCRFDRNHLLTRMARHFQYWGALYILALLFLGSLVGQLLFQVVIGGESLDKFMSATLENWRSEWIQLFVQALLLQGLGHVLYRKEMEDQERMERKPDNMLHLLKESRGKPPE
jgi:hypothetical protein